MAKPTSEPLHDQLVGFDFLAHGLLDLEKRYRSINCAATSIQGFTMMFLFVRIQDSDEAIRPVLGVDMLSVELLDGFFEIHNLAV